MVKGTVIKRSARLIDRIDLENEKTLLNLAENYRAKKYYLKAKKALEEVVEESSDRIYVARTRRDIEKLNISILFSDIMTDDSFTYEIKPGDTLAKIASRFNTTVELLKKSNDLKADVILPGKFLKVNKANFNILIDRSENTLALNKHNGEIVRTYIVSTGENFSTPTGTFKIEEKLISPVWYKVGAIVDPDSPQYELGACWMGLSVEGYGIHGTNDTSSIGKHITKGCVRMTNSDVEELYAIVPSGTEVTIVE